MTLAERAHLLRVALNQSLQLRLGDQRAIITEQEEKEMILFALELTAKEAIFQERWRRGDGT